MGPSQVLLVNDDAMARQFFKLQLEMFGHSVSLANDGPNALALLEQRAFDLVLLDLNMPGMNGHEVLATLQQRDLLALMPVIVISASENRQDILRCLELGACDYLSPPVDGAILRARVSAALGWHRLRELEMDTLRGLAQLVRAAEAMDQGTFKPDQLKAWIERPDSLGELARALEKLARDRLGGAGADMAELRAQLAQVEQNLASQPASCITGTVLVVEDDPAGRSILTTYLKQLGYEVEVAVDGQDGLDKVAGKSFDTILMDVMMPRLDGFAMLAQLKADPTTRDIPVVALSAVEDLEQVVRLIELGAHDHLSKPFKAPLLKARLQSCLLQKRMRDGELSTLRGLARLSQAAADLEGESYQPGRLNDLARRGDMLGQLARVFQTMAAEVHNRQQNLRRQVSELRQELEQARQRSATSSTEQNYAQTLDTRMGTAKIHMLASFRGGSGKTSLTANLGILLANAGMRVALVDMALSAPGLHIPFGLTSRDLPRTLHDFLADACELQEVAMDLSSYLSLSGSGKLFLLPASAGVHSLARLMRHGYDAQEFATALRTLVEELSLDLILLDTHPGLSEELLLSMLLATGVSLILKADSSDLEGAGAIIQVARKLGLEHPDLILNQLPPDQNGQHYSQTLQVEVAGTIPRGEALDPLFCLRQPEGAPARALTAISRRLLR